MRTRLPYRHWDLKDVEGLIQLTAREPGGINTLTSHSPSFQASHWPTRSYRARELLNIHVDHVDHGRQSRVRRLEARSKGAMGCIQNRAYWFDIRPRPHWIWALCGHANWENRETFISIIKEFIFLLLALDSLCLRSFLLWTTTLYIVLVSKVIWSLKSQFVKPVKDKLSQRDSLHGDIWKRDLLWFSVWLQMQDTLSARVAAELPSLSPREATFRLPGNWRLAMLKPPQRWH